MNLSQPSLYADIESFEIGETNIPLSFSARLGRENGWSVLYSNRVITEYKKFIYLCCISSKELTPSDQVDQVWHLHLTYTQSYWNDMCRSVLERELHHGPTKGGAEQTEKYKQQYLYTIKLYNKEFGEKPPKDIWPSVSKRFKAVDKFLRVNEVAYWVIKKPSKYFLPLVLTPMFLIACTKTEASSDFWFYIKAAIGVYVAYKIIESINKNTNGKGSGCG